MSIESANLFELLRPLPPKDRRKALKWLYTRSPEECAETAEVMTGRSPDEIVDLFGWLTAILPDNPLPWHVDWDLVEKRLETVEGFALDEVVNVTKAAEISGYTRNHVRKLAREGRINARKGLDWFIFLDSLSEYAKAHGRMSGGVLCLAC
jgi:hypothetical protein